MGWMVELGEVRPCWDCKFRWPRMFTSRFSMRTMGMGKEIEMGMGLCVCVWGGGRRRMQVWTCLELIKIGAI